MVASCSVTSLISAISTANTTPADSSISLASGCVYSLTAANNATDGGTGLPVITGQVSIQGNGATITRSATAAFRLLDVASGGSLSLSGLTLSNGLANDGVSGGGAIFNHGPLTVSQTTFSGNSAPAATGTSGGAIDASGPLTVSLSTFRGNTAQEGGGILTQNTASVTNSTFAGNTATIFGGGAIVSVVGTLTVTGSTFTGNTGPGGGAIDNDATVHVSNSTFTGNTAGGNGGGAIGNFGTATITQSTLSGNSSAFGANLHNLTTGAPMTVTQSIVANAKNNTNPQLGALASNGGPTQTMALPPGSPAVNAIPATVPGCSGSTDQRGVSRPQGPACDVGAYELASQTPPPPPPGGPIRGFAGKCVDDFHSGTANRNKIDLFRCNGTAAQRWVFASNGQLRVFGKCLDDPASRGNGTKLELFTCNGGANQKWTHRSNGEYVLRANNLCLDDPGFSTKDGTQLVIWHCNGGANQRWSLP